MYQRDIIVKMKAWFEARNGWIIHFDNAPDYATIKEFIPAKNGKVIVSSRNTDWPERNNTIEVGIFTPEEAKEYLKKVIPHKMVSDQEVDDLIQLLGCLPLALAQASAYLALTHDMTMAQYTAQCRQTMDLLSHELFLANSHEMPKTVRTTWRITLGEIQKKNPFAVQILALCAFLAPENISREIIIIYLRNIGKENNLDISLQYLSLFSMINYNKKTGYYNMHRLVQAVMRLDYCDAGLINTILLSYLSYLHDTIDNADQIDVKNVFFLITHLGAISDNVLWLFEKSKKNWPFELQINLARINFYLAILNKKCGFPDESEEILNKTQAYLDKVRCSSHKEMDNVLIVKARIYCRIALVKIIYSSATMKDESESFLARLPAYALDTDEQRLTRAELLNSRAMYLLMQQNTGSQRNPKIV